MDNGLFTLEPGRWYGWEMILGYGGGGGRYFSPILVERVEPLKTGRGEMRLAFFNAFYASGVRDFAPTVRVMKRAERFMIVELIDGNGESQRAAVIGDVTLAWLERFAEGVLKQRPIREYEAGGGRSLDGYLSWAFRMKPVGE